jgi:3-hydroxyisobutyrate dehydrogenase-like beta-hydroxyacid dehydrogenase
MVTDSVTGSKTVNPTFIGFGEAAMAFVSGWGVTAEAGIRAYDIKTDDPSPEVREAKRQDYDRFGVAGCDTAAEALDGAAVVFSTVTADQALAAAREAAPYLEAGTLYLDCNSCAPGTKSRAAEAISEAGARYVDVAVMAPVTPALHRTPLLLAGPHAGAAADILAGLDMRASVAGDAVGIASTIKMIRSIMMKGLEALVAECVLSARRAGVDQIVLDSLDETYPGFDWKRRSAYMLERSVIHGVRRAAEMREAVATVEELGLDGSMSRATVAWQQRIGDLGLAAGNGAETGYGDLADAILRRLNDGDG